MTPSELPPQGAAGNAAASLALIAGLKAAIFDALAATPVAEVLVEYDTDGDDGELDIHPFACIGHNGRAVACPQMTISQPLILAPSEEPKSGLALADAIFALAGLLLDREPCAWVGEDGAFGSFRFLVPFRAIKLSHSRRYLNYQTLSCSF